MIRYFTNPNFDVEMYFGGDSINRARITLDIFENGFEWRHGGFWLPFQFVLFSIPLYFSKTITSLIIFQYLITSISFYIFFRLISNLFGKTNAYISTIIIGFMPMHILLSATMMSGMLYITLIFSSLFYGIKFLSLKLNRYYFLSMGLMACAGMTRYEGCFLFIFSLSYFFWSERNYKNSFGALFLLLIPLTFYEYYHYLDTKIFLYGLVTNGAESLKVNIEVLGFDTALKRFEALIRIIINQSGLILFLCLFNMDFKKILSIKKYQFYFLITFATFGMVLIGSIKGDVALFNRYWIAPICLLIPFGVRAIEGILKGRNGNEQSSLKTLTLLLLFFTIPFMAIKPYYVFPIKSYGITELVKTLRKDKTPIKENNLFVDDLYGRWLFDAVYLNLKLQGFEVHCCNVNNLDYFSSAFKFDDSIKKIIYEIDKSNQLEYFILFEGSAVFNYLKNQNFELNDIHLSFIMKSGTTYLFKRI